MAELPERDAALLLDMLFAAPDAQAFVEGLDETGFLASPLHQNATIRSLEVIGEAAGKVSVATRTAHPEIPWREITGMRHRLIHGYAEVRLDLVWLVLGDHLGPLIAGGAPPRPEQGPPINRTQIFKPITSLAGRIALRAAVLGPPQASSGKAPELCAIPVLQRIMSSAVTVRTDEIDRTCAAHAVLCLQLAVPHGKPADAIRLRSL